MTYSPPDIYIWQKAESTAKEIFSAYGFQEIRVPIIESTDIFVRSIGETTDIVEKEMYTFPDRADREHHAEAWKAQRLL